MPGTIGAYVHTARAAPQARWLRTTMSSAVVPGDDPRDASAEAPLSLPEKWQTDSFGAHLCPRRRLMPSADRVP